MIARTRPGLRRTVPAQRDPNSLVASASILTGPRASGAKVTVEQWQSDAWHYYDTVGELRFAVNWKANALSRVNLIAATPAQRQGDEPQAVDLTVSPGLRRAVEIVEEIAGGVTGQGQLLAGCARQLTVPGVGYIHIGADAETDTFSTWSVLSNEEVRRQQGGAEGALEITNAETGAWEPIGEKDIIIKVWQAHPRKRHEPDSPVRAVLTPLSEIEKLSLAVKAAGDSRLIGAGVLVLGESIEFPPGQGQPDVQVVEGKPVPDEFILTFNQVASLAYSNPGDPSARVPLVIKVPDDVVDKIRHIKFSTDLDQQIDPLRMAAIKRVALGLDMPPEVLLGMGQSNHWSAWQIAEEAITLHIEPICEVICHALTKQFLRAALEGEGIDPDSIIVWYDTSDLVTRPDLTAAATVAYANGAISTEAFLGYIGLDAGDQPLVAERNLRILLDIAKTVPTLAPAILGYLEILPAEVAAGLQTIAELDRAPQLGGDDPAPDVTPTNGPPAEPDATDTPDDSAAILASADALVIRALERAGMRLRTAVRKVPAAAQASASCADPVLLHTHVSATEHASMTALLADAWDRVPAVAARYGLDADSLTTALDGYTRGLIAAGHAHDYDRLAAVLGVTRDRHLVTA